MNNDVDELNSRLEKVLINGMATISMDEREIMEKKLKMGWPELTGALLSNYALYMLIIHKMDIDKCEVKCNGEVVDAAFLKSISLQFRKKFQPMFGDKLGIFMGKSLAVGTLTYNSLKTK